MKISTLLLILLLCLGLLAYVVENKTGQVSVFLESRGISILEKGTDNNVENSGPIAVGPAPVVLDLPEGFNKTSYRSLPSSFVLYEAELTYVTNTSLGEEEWFLISQYLSEADYKQALSGFLSPNSYKGLRAVSAPISSLIVGGQESYQYVISLYDEDPANGNELIINKHFIVVPSKFVVISFEHIPDFPDYEFTIPEIMNIISLIKFDNNPNHKLISQKKSPEQIASEKVITNTQEALGITFGLPEGKKIEVVPEANSITDGATKVQTAFILLVDEGGIVVERYNSKADFDKSVGNTTNMPGSAEEGVVRFPAESLKIDGQDAIQYHYSINNIDMYQITVPSKLVSINFVLQVLVDYSIEDVQKLISTIRFNY